MSEEFKMSSLTGWIFSIGLIGTIIGAVVPPYIMFGDGKAAMKNDMAGFAIIGAFIVFGILGGIIGGIAGAILYLRKCKPAAAGWICVVIGSVIAVQLCLIWFQGEPKMTTISMNSETGRENLAWMIGPPILVIFPLIYSGFRLIKSSKKYIGDS